jgi:hypothetical protein
MKLHHAVAIALVGWYVLVPPTTEDLALDLKAPLSQWIKPKSFEGLHDCILDAGELHERAAGNQSIRPSLKFTGFQLRQFGEAICASDDDLRVKEK